jgi:TonB family protein
MKRYLLMIVLLTLIIGVADGQSAITPFSTRDGRFTVQMPGSNVEEDVSSTYTSTGTVKSSDGHSSYTISCKHYCGVFNKAEEQIRLLNANLEALKSADTKVIKESDLTIEEQYTGTTITHPGKEIVLESDFEMIQHRIYFVRDTFYQLTARSPKSTTIPPAYQIFFSSFRLGIDEKLAKKPIELSGNVGGVLGGVPGPIPGQESGTKGTTSQTEGTIKGNAIRLVQPPYPLLARNSRIQGSVEVEVTIDEEGNVIAAIARCGPPLLLSAAVNAARNSLFKPTTLSGVPVKVQGILTYNFYLQ